MFIENDEHLIIMDELRNELLLDELKMLVDCGIRTIYYQGAIRWNELQPRQDSPVNWKFFDDYLENLYQAGLKVLIPFVYQLPIWKPDDWYLTKVQLGIFNYLNPQVGNDLDEFAGQFVEHYGGSKFQLIYSMPADGEFPAEFGPITPKFLFGNDLLAEFVVARQRLFEAQHNEIWTSFHHYTAPDWIEAVYCALRAEFSNSRHYGIQFTHFIHGMERLNKALAYMRDQYGMRYYVGSEYCQGLRTNVPQAISQGIHGLITSPIHSPQPYRRIEPWMLEELRWAIREMEAVYA